MGVGTICHLIVWNSVGIEVLAVAAMAAAIVPFALIRYAVRYIPQCSTSGTTGTAENESPS
jgi:hypothetical protein